VSGEKKKKKETGDSGMQEGGRKGGNHRVYSEGEKKRGRKALKTLRKRGPDYREERGLGRFSPFNLQGKKEEGAREEQMGDARKDESLNTR